MQFRLFSIPEYKHYSTSITCAFQDRPFCHQSPPTSQWHCPQPGHSSPRRLLPSSHRPPCEPHPAELTNNFTDKCHFIAFQWHTQHICVWHKRWRLYVVRWLRLWRSSCTICDVVIITNIIPESNQAIQGRTILVNSNY